MPRTPARARTEAMVNAVLIALGTLAVVDNVVFHLVLGFHWFKEGWSCNIYVEVLLVMLGAVAVVLGVRREHRAGMAHVNPSKTAEIRSRRGLTNHAGRQ